MLVGVGLGPVGTAVAGATNERFPLQTGLQLAGTSDEIGVDVRLHYMPDMQVVVAGVAKEIIHVAGGVDRRCLAAFLVPHNVGGDGQARHERGEDGPRWPVPSIQGQPLGAGCSTDSLGRPATGRELGPHAPRSQVATPMRGSTQSWSTSQTTTKPNTTSSSMPLLLSMSFPSLFTVRALIQEN
jgi:hypothetical protein